MLRNLPPFRTKRPVDRAVGVIAVPYETTTVRMTSCFTDDANRFQRT